MGVTVSRLCHALLTEDESVLLRALEPSGADRILAIFAHGNGDAALSLLQTAPQTIYVHDHFDQPSLTAQIRLKHWLYQNLDCASFRRFLGIEAGFDVAKRSEIIEAMLYDLPGSDHEYWRERVGCLRRGMANSDSTHLWTRGLRLFYAIHGRVPVVCQRALLRLGMPLAPLFFPREERIHSLGYQQMKKHPARAMGRLMDRSQMVSGVGSIALYRNFAYLSVKGHAAIREGFSRLEFVDELHPGMQYDKIYLSNLIDYVSRDAFHGILKTLLPGRTRRWTMFLNSTYESTSEHPYLQAGLDDGLFRIDWARTNVLRACDQVGVYPGLTVLRAA